MESGGKGISSLAAAETRWTFHAFRLIPTGLRGDVTHGAHEIWFKQRLPKDFCTNLSSYDPAGSDDLEEGDQHVIS